MSMGEEARGPETKKSYENVKTALDSALDQSPVPVTTLKHVVENEKCDFSRATVNKRLSEIVSAPDETMTSGVLNDVTYYWDSSEVDAGRVSAFTGGGLFRAYLYNALAIFQRGEPRTVQALLPYALKLRWRKAIRMFLMQVAHAAVLFVGITVVFPTMVTTQTDAVTLFLVILAVAAAADGLSRALRNYPEPGGSKE